MRDILLLRVHGTGTARPNRPADGPSDDAQGANGMKAPPAVDEGVHGRDPRTWPHVRTHG